MSKKKYWIKIIALLVLAVFGFQQISYAGILSDTYNQLKSRAKSVYTAASNTSVPSFNQIQNRIYNGAIWIRDESIFKPGYFDTPRGKMESEAFSQALVATPLGEFRVGIAGIGALGARLLSKAPSFSKYADDIAKVGNKFTTNVKPGLNSGRVVDSMALNKVIYRAPSALKTGNSLFWNSRPVSGWAKYAIAPAGIGVAAGTVYVLSPYKSSAFKTSTLNQANINNLMNGMSRDLHSLEPGSFSQKNYDAAIGTLSEVFPDNTASQEKIKSYLEHNPQKFTGIKTDDRTVSYLTNIVKLGNENKKLTADFNPLEKGFTYAAEVNNLVFNSLGDGINYIGIPLAGDFVKTVGSFTPLTGPSIGASMMADPVGGLQGLASFIVNPIEAGIGLRRGSIVDGTFDYHANYRSFGEAAGSAFILMGGGRQAINTGKSIKTGIGAYLGDTKTAINSFLSASYPKIHSTLSHPGVKPVVANALFLGPLAVGALLQAQQENKWGAALVPGAIIVGKQAVPVGISVAQAKLSQEPLIVARGEVVAKPEGMDNAFSILGKMKTPEGKDFDIKAYAAGGGTFAAIAKPGKPFEVGPYRYTEFESDKTNEYILYPSLLKADVGQPVMLMPAILPGHNLNNDDKFKKKLKTAEIKVAETKELSSNKKPIPVEKLRDDQVSTLKKMANELTPQDRLAIIRGLGTGKTTALLSYALPYRIGDNLKRGKVTLIFTPNNEVTNDVQMILEGAKAQGFNHKEIQERLGTHIEFPNEITEKKLKIESITRNEDSFKQQEDFIEKVMNNDVVVVPYELYSSFHHTYLMRLGKTDPTIKKNVIERIQDSFFIMDELDAPVFFPALMMSEGRMYLPPEHPEYKYWLDIEGVSGRLYDNAKYKKINANEFDTEKIEGESDAELNFRRFAQSQKLMNENIPAIEDLPLSGSAAIKSLVSEIRNRHLDIPYTDEKIAEHIVGGFRGHRDYELRVLSLKEEYAIKTETIPAEQIDTYGPKKAVNTVKVIGVEGRKIHNRDLHIPAGEQQTLEILNGAKLISRPLEGDHIGKPIDALQILGGGIGFTGTASDTAKPILKEAGFTEFDYGEVKHSDFEAPIVNEDLSQTVKQVTDDIINNKGRRLDIDITPNNLFSRRIQKILASKGIRPAVLVKEGENFKFKEGRYVHIGGRTPEKVAKALLDSLKTENAPYAIVGASDLVGRGLNFDPSPYLARDDTKVVVNLIEPEVMTATQAEQAAGRIGGEFRFTNLIDGKGNIHNPQKSVRLLMSKDMMRFIPEFNDILKEGEFNGIKSLKTIDALKKVWNENERDVVSRSGFFSEITAVNSERSEFKEAHIPDTLEKITHSRIRDYIIAKGYVRESIVKKGSANIKEHTLTINGLQFMRLFNEAESLSDEQQKLLDKLENIRLLSMDNPAQFAIGLAENGFVELENYSQRGLSSLIRLARILGPLNANISKEEVNNYQDIMNKSLEQQLNFIKELIDKNKVKISDTSTKEAILSKFNFEQQVLGEIQEISQQIQDDKERNNKQAEPIDEWRKYNAYKRFENALNLGDLKALAKKLGAASAVDIIPLFIPTIDSASIEKLSKITAFIESSNINVDSQNIFNLIGIVDNKAAFMKFLAENAKDPNLKIYAQRLSIYYDALEKPSLRQYLFFKYLLNQMDEKGTQTDELNKQSNELRKQLENDEDIIFLNNYGVNPLEDFELDLGKLRILADNKLSDELLLKVYLGIESSSEDIQEVIDVFRISQWQEEMSTPSLMSELRILQRLYGVEKAVSELQRLGYPQTQIDDAIRLLNQKSSSRNLERELSIQMQPLASSSSVQLPKISPITTAVDAAITRVNLAADKVLSAD